MSEQRRIVAVDVGGSGLRLQVSAAGVTGPVRSADGVRVGADGIDIDRLVASARALLAEPDAAADVVVWSMRGLLFLSDRNEVLDAVTAGLGGRDTVVVSDAVAGLVGAIGDVRPGAVVAAGTGAVAFGTDFADHWNRVDGWGHVLGDVGSAAWIGLAALRSALRAFDGFPDGSPALLAGTRQLMGEPETWPRLVMTSADAPERLASIAPVVTSMADADPIAGGICAAAGAGLADSLLLAASGLTQTETIVLTATGGLLTAEPVARALADRLAETGRWLTPARGTALDGATAIGRHLLAASTLDSRPPYVLHRRA